jgi:hypothetical protein
MPTLNYSVAVSGLGGNIAQNIPRSADGGSIREVSLPVGKAGTLTTRTDVNTGQITMASGGHGITTGANVDIYWDGGVQYNATVGTVVGTTVPFDGGEGDDLPTNGTDVVVSVRQLISLDLDGDSLTLLAINQKYSNNLETAISHITFYDSGPNEIAELDLQANTPQVFDIIGGATNIFTGNPIVNAFASNGSTSDAATLQLLWLQDSTP